MLPSRVIQTLLTVLPVLTAGLYLLGLTYHQGYLAEFGIDDSLFPLASDKALFTGFFSLVIVAFPAGVYALAAIVAFVVLVILAAILSSTERVQSIVNRIKDWRNRRQHSKIPELTENLIDRGTVAYTYVGGIVIGLLLLVAIAAFSTKSGHEQATKEKAAFAAKQAPLTKLFTPQFQQPQEGKLVICGSTYCALWNGSSTFVVRHEGIDRMVSTPPLQTAK